MRCGTSAKGTPEARSSSPCEDSNGALGEPIPSSSPGALLGLGQHAEAAVQTRGGALTNGGRPSLSLSVNVRDEPAAPAIAIPMDVPALIAGLVTVTAWSSAFVEIRSAGGTFSPGALALGRLLVSCVLLGAVALVRRESLPRRRDLLAIALYGVLWLGVYSVTLNAAERHIDAGTAAMLVNTGPILIAVLAGLVLQEGFPRGLFAGCAVAFGGCVLIGVGTTRSGGTAGVGVALCILAAFAYSSAVIVQKAVLARVSAFQVTWLGCAAAAVACLRWARHRSGWQWPAARSAWRASILLAGVDEQLEPSFSAAAIAGPRTTSSAGVNTTRVIRLDGLDRRPPGRGPAYPARKGEATAGRRRVPAALANARPLVDWEVVSRRARARPRRPARRLQRAAPRARARAAPRLRS